MMTTILIANRGEIARRIARTCRRLGHRAVVVCSEADRGLPFVREADLAITIGPGPAAESYLDAARILDAARRAGADAVHPGYGFLAENAAFARAVLDAGLVWVGPPPEAIAAVGDKGAARALAQRLGVPTVPGHQGDQGDEALAAAARRIGVPLLIKASAGGGGRGMRRVDDLARFGEALASARREAAASFGSDEVVLERFVERPRHVEVQVFGDAHGACLHLGERECSIQRRHQKVIEEAPSPAVDAALRLRLGEAAVTLARAVGYVGAGTAEFLLEPDGTFSFLEMNTRLQVEHPVTESITGIDLVAWQLHVAAGGRLPLTQDQVKLEGWAIEARICAEDALRDHLPATGTLLRFDVEDAEGIRVDAGFEAGSVVSPHYDSLLAKVVARGPDRATATRRLRRALDRAWVPGVVNNLPLLRQILASEAWAAGDLDTGFLARNGLPRAPPLHLAEGALAGTALLWHQRRGRYPAPLGWRLHGFAEEQDSWRCGDQLAEVRWRPEGGGVRVDLRAEGVARSALVEVHRRDGDALDLEIDGVRATWRVAVRPAGPPAPGGSELTDGDVLYVHTGTGEAFVSLVPRFPPPAAAAAERGTASAPTPGRVVAVHVELGQRVPAGQRLVTLEAMKMEHPVVAPEAGTVVELRVAVGDAVAEGDLLARLEGDPD